jgi:hypothetical protein
LLLLSLFILSLAGCKGSGKDQPGAQLVAIEVTPTESTIAIETDQQFIATGIYSDNSTKDLTASAEWSSSDPAIAIIATGTEAGMSGTSSVELSQTTAGGTVYGTGEGTTTITATSSGVTGSGNLRVKRVKLVSIEVTPTNPVLAEGSSQQFIATGTFSDNTTQNITASVSWISSNSATATIAPGGMAASVDSGTTVITAKSASITGSTNLTVNPASLVSITVTPANPEIAKGTTQQFTATGLFSDNSIQDVTTTATWSSSDTNVATVGNTIGSKGLTTGLAGGAATVTATSGDISGSTLLTVNGVNLVSIAIAPVNPAIAKGTKQQFTATGTFSDSTTQNLTASVTWSSSNTGVATISNAAGANGLASSVAAGSTTIKAVSGSISGSTTLTVNPATLMSIAVTPSNQTIAKGANQQFTATGTFSDSSTQNLTAAVTWSSSNTAAATISNAAGSNGLATSIAEGSTTIKAMSGTVSGTAALSVADRSVSLKWDAPTTNTDGTALTDLAGYKLRYGNSPGVYQTTLTLGTGTSYALNNLAAGTYYFTVTAFNNGGIESTFSNETWKTIQ